MPDGSSMCPRCGTASSPGERFCRHCGYDLMTPTRPLTSGDARRRVAELSIGRGVSDEIISPLWVLVPLLALVVGFMAGILLLFFDLSTGGFIIFLGFAVAAFLFIYMNYKLIDRMNKHLAREAALRRAMIDLILAELRRRGRRRRCNPTSSRWRA